MALINGLGLTAFSQNMAGRGFEGDIADTEGVRAHAYRVPLRAQVTNIAISGFGADADSITVRITKPDGTVVPFTVTRASSVPVDDAAAATALAALINASQTLRGHVIASVNSANLVLTFQHTNVVYPVATSVTSAVATVSTTTEAGGTSVVFGRFVKAGASVDGQPAVAALEAGDSERVITGVTLRHLAVEQGGSPLASAVDAVPAGDMTPVAYGGHVLMRNNGSVASAVGGTVYAVVASTGGDEVGEARADGAGVQQVATGTPAAANTTAYLVQLRMDDGSIYTANYLSDGSATAAEIVAGLIADFGTVPGVTFSGTNTLIITGAAGRSFTVNDLGTGSVAFVATTPAAPYTVPIDYRRARWAEVVEPDAIGPVWLEV